MRGGVSSFAFLREATVGSTPWRAHSAGCDAGCEAGTLAGWDADAGAVADGRGTRPADRSKTLYPLAREGLVSSGLLAASHSAEGDGGASVLTARLASTGSEGRSATADESGRFSPTASVRTSASSNLSQSTCRMSAGCCSSCGCGGGATSDLGEAGEAADVRLFASTTSRIAGSLSFAGGAASSRRAAAGFAAKDGDAEPAVLARATAGGTSSTVDSAC